MAEINKDDLKIGVTFTPCKDCDRVEVVRCKDCKHFTKGMAIGMCKRIEDKPIMPMPYNNYCGFGERKKTNENLL